MTTGTRVLTVYAREWCSLCDDMYAALVALRPELAVEIDMVFIDGDETLEALYGAKVPVLKEADTEICHYFLDRDALRAHLAR